MQPFFSYYGSKWMGARKFGPPRRDLVIEPFAGSACYSTWWEAPAVRLYDLSEDVCAAWDWIIHCSGDDVRALPDAFRSTDEWAALPDGPRQFVFWNIGWAQARIGKTLKSWYLHYVHTGEKIGGLRTCPSLRFWGPRIKASIIRNKPKIRNWTIEQMDYRDIPDADAHWHIDPPYSGKPGRAYLHSEIDFAHLGQWCRSRSGAVDVCENAGADWLPFEPLYSLKTAAGSSVSREVVWRNEAVDLLGMM